MPPSSVKCAVKHQGACEMFALLNTSVMEGRKEGRGCNTVELH